MANDLPDNPELMCACVHESGHAVVFHELTSEWGDLSVAAPDSSGLIPGKHSHSIEMSPIDRLTHLLAGGMAESAWVSQTRAAGDSLVRGTGVDREVIAELMCSFFRNEDESTIHEEAKRRARAILSRRWAEVIKLATQLFQAPPDHSGRRMLVESQIVKLVS